MLKKTGRFDIESELEEVRQTMGLQEPEVQTQANNNLNRGTSNRRASNTFGGALWGVLAVLVLVLGAGSLAAWALSQSLAKSQAALAEAERVKNAPTVSALGAVGQDLRETMAVLEKIPNVPGTGYERVEADLTKLRGSLQEIEYNRQAGESLKAAEDIAMEAAMLVQNSPHPLQVWRQAEDKWLQAIASLETIPRDSYVGEKSLEKLSAYRSNRAAIGKRVEIAQKAVSFSNQGAAKISQGDYKLAIQYFDQAIGLNSHLAEAYLGRGIALSELGNNQKAIQEYDKAIQFNPYLAQTYYYRGWSRYELGNANRALADYDEAIRLEPNYAEAYLERGGARYQTGLQEEGIEDWHKAASLFSDRGDRQNYQIAQNAIDQLQDNAEVSVDGASDAELAECDKLAASNSFPETCPPRNEIYVRRRKRRIRILDFDYFPSGSGSRSTGEREKTGSNTGGDTGGDRSLDSSGSRGNDASSGSRSSGSRSRGGSFRRRRKSR